MSVISLRLRMKGSHNGKQRASADTTERISRGVLPARRAPAATDVLVESLPAAATEASAAPGVCFAPETRRHRSRRRRTLVFRVSVPMHKPRYSLFSLFSLSLTLFLSTSSTSFPGLINSLSFYTRSDRESYKETFSICPSYPAYFHRGVLRLLTLSPFCSRTRARERGVLEIKGLARQENLNQETHRATS